MTAPQVPGDGKEGQGRCGALAPDMSRRYGPTCTLAPHDDGEHSNGTVSWHTCPAPSSAAPVTGDAQRQVRDDRGYFDGFEPRECGEHRTVGDHRAWCYECSEWCYPRSPCARCEIVRLRQAILTLREEVGAATGDAQRALLDAADALDRLPELLTTERARRGLSVRAAAAEAGIGFNTYFRTERGGQTSRAHAAALLRWLSAPGAAALTGSPDTGEGDTL